MEKTIASISTPLGTGAISIVRLSGKNSLNLAFQFFKARNLNKENIKPRYLYLGNFSSNEVNEKCLMVYFKAPYSFTGDEMIEFQIHGGEFLAQSILKQLISAGASLAENGEFSKMAFLNGKLSLDEAEGIIDVIEATSKAELKAGYELMQGKLFKTVEKLQHQLTEIIARIDVTLDYPEHDDEEVEKQYAKGVLTNVLKEIEVLLLNNKHSYLIKSGVNVALVGKPNVGKSSLLNALLGHERAIVTNIKGTTRDTIKETLVYKGIKFNFIDTAGLRNSTDEVEKIGIDKTLQTIKSSDIILFLLDGTEQIDDEDKKIFKQISNHNHLVVLNKTDMKIKQEIEFEEIFEISALTNYNIEELKQKLYEKTIKDKIDTSQIVLTNQRHIEKLQNAKELTISAINTVENVSSDIANFEIRKVWAELGKITGVSENETIIDEIFSRFCLGK
jgi:tRNA modification GTPase